MKHIIKVEVLENLPLTRPLIAADVNGNLFWQKELPAPVGPPNDEIWYTSSDGQEVTPYSTSGWPAFTNTYSDGKGVIKFETDITGIGNDAFRDRARLTSIEIPNSVTNIGQRSFRNCTGLTSVTIPNSVTTIGQYAFSGCTGLISVTIPNSVTTIGYNAFHNCSGLISVTIGNGVTTIGSNAFEGCSSLTSVTIPNSVTSIGLGAFYYCTSLTTILMGNSVTSIGKNAFTGCSSLPVEDGLRYADTYLVEVVDNTRSSYSIKTGTKWIGFQAFRRRSDMTSVTIPNSVISIGEGAFDGCSGLTSVTIPNSVINIGNTAFYGCSGLIKVNITDVAAWCRITFGISSANPLSYAKHLFVNDVEVTNLVIPNGVTSIGDLAFQGYSGLTSVTIPNSVTSIGNYAFDQCDNLTSVTMGNNVISIGNYAFCGCNELTSVTIPNSVTSIGDNAFWDGAEYGSGYSGLLEKIIVGETEFPYNGEDWFTITLGNGTDVELLMWTSSCFLSDTEITLADGTKKQVKDITYDDKLKVWNFDEGHYDEGEIAWLTKVGLKNNHYYQLTFSDGTILKTTGVHSNHKVYCTDTNKFEGVAYIEVGAHVFTENGIVSITDKQYIEEEVEYYNLITKQHFNCFANGVLTSDRYGNIYPISDEMIFIKNGRPIRPYSEFEAVNIKRYWYDTLRLGENTETINETRKYITKLEVQMRPIE